MDKPDWRLLSEELAKWTRNWRPKWVEVTSVVEGDGVDWSGEWIVDNTNDDEDPDEIDGSCGSDYGPDFASFIANLVNTAPDLVAYIYRLEKTIINAVHCAETTGNIDPLTGDMRKLIGMPT